MKLLTHISSNSTSVIFSSLHWVLSLQAVLQKYQPNIPSNKFGDNQNLNLFQSEKVMCF